ncbi:hypothetical protein F5Y01DRAFT_84503 [Xylaria sp. FL0043]|nr:hypothetical protein F5Y01DRAFT_84503 [Xylaria sp. FL0043]
MRRKARSLVPLSKRKGWLVWAPSLLFGKYTGDIRAQNPTIKSHSTRVNAPIVCKMVHSSGYSGRQAENERNPTYLLKTRRDDLVHSPTEYEILRSSAPGLRIFYRTGLSPSCRRTGSATLRIKMESHCAITTVNTGVTSSENLHSTVDMSLWFCIPVAVLGSLQSGETIVTNDEIRFQGPLTNDWSPFVSVMATQFKFGNISLIKAREWRRKGFTIDQSVRSHPVV